MEISSMEIEGSKKRSVTIQKVNSHPFWKDLSYKVSTVLMLVLAFIIEKN